MAIRRMPLSNNSVLTSDKLIPVWDPQLITNETNTRLYLSQSYQSQTPEPLSQSVRPFFVFVKGSLEIWTEGVTVTMNWWIQVPPFHHYSPLSPSDFLSHENPSPRWKELEKGNIKGIVVNWKWLKQNQLNPIKNNLHQLKRGTLGGGGRT